MRALLLTSLGLLLPACGEGGAPTPPTPLSPSVVEVAVVEAPVAAETAAAGPHVFVQVAAQTDKTEYELGEAIEVRRTFENVGRLPLDVKAGDGGLRSYREVVLTSKCGSGLYEAAWLEFPGGVLAPGERVEGRIRVELPGPGTYTIEVPPEYRARSGDGRTVHLDVNVVDRGDRRHVEAKAERLGRLIAAETSGDPRLWTEAQKDAETLGAAVVPSLRRWLRESESAHLRGVAAKLLFHVKGREGIEDIVAGLRDGDATVRKACLDTLGAFRDPETLDAILPTIEDPDEWVRIEAVGTLASFDDPRVVPALRTLLEDASSYVRRWAAVHLAELGDASGIRVLVQALEADPAGEAGTVVPALETLTGESFGKADHPRIYSGFDQVDEAVERCRTVAAKWIAWWEDEGLTRYGGR